MVDKVAANKTSAAGHQNRHGVPWLCAFLALQLFSSLAL
jgi:hypothetical protein